LTAYAALKSALSIPPSLLPDDANAQARAIAWMFAALNTMEPPVLELVTARILEGDKPWCKERLPLVEDRIRDRLKQLSARLGSADWLDGTFSAGDLMMVSVLLRIKSSGIVDEFPNLAAYLARARRGLRTSGRLRRSWRLTRARNRRSQGQKVLSAVPANFFQRAVSAHACGLENALRLALQAHRETRVASCRR
jgi:glutathione S-transferase